MRSPVAGTHERRCSRTRPRPVKIDPGRPGLARCETRSARPPGGTPAERWPAKARAPDPDPREAVPGDSGTFPDTPAKTRAVAHRIRSPPPVVDPPARPSITRPSSATISIRPVAMIHLAGGFSETVPTPSRDVAIRLGGPGLPRNRPFGTKSPVPPGGTFR
jgi:hypothetical protein